VFIDLDKFKQNDERFDVAMPCGGCRIRSHLRAGDIVGLWWRRIALLLPGMDDRASEMSTICAASACGNARKQLASHQYRHCQLSPGARNFDDLLGEADRLMYQVKESGRDRILQRIPDNFIASAHQHPPFSPSGGFPMQLGLIIGIVCASAWSSSPCKTSRRSR
jgi:GGDEF domain-containing protein